ncbi:sensor histidine kinase [Cohnella terricola]|uniref:histidine kinase n=1 Tax=Cohnella terricola TaxID=1289167 RepID=A0A559J9Y8_9BACL|nr:sensor histidine kinase [Cohnella terricola]
MLWNTLEGLLWLALGSFALFAGHFVVRWSSLQEQWRHSYVRNYLYLPWGYAFKEVKLTLVVVGFAVLSALAGISAWNLTFRYYYVERWYVLYDIFYVFVVLPYAWNLIGKFHRIRLGVEAAAAGNLQSAIDVKGKDAFTALASRINNMKAGYRVALEEQMKSERLKSELITNVSHDLKTPLTSIINYVDLLKQKDLSPEESSAYVDVLDRKSMRLKTLIEDLFEASKVASGAVELDLREIDVAALLNQTLAELGDNSDDIAPLLRVKIGKPHIYAYLDGNKTQRVFENLIGNARKYSLPGTRIYLSLEETDDRVSFRIQNTSSYEIDFAAEELFERFKRADESRHSEGSGLGLAIARSIVELQGGSIRIDIQGDQFNVLIDFPKHEI